MRFLMLMIATVAIMLGSTVSAFAGCDKYNCDPRPVCQKPGGYGTEYCK